MVRVDEDLPPRSPDHGTVITPAPARHFRCRACGREQATWTARCPSCLSLEGLAATTESRDPPPESPETRRPSPQPSEPPLPAPPRPRLTIARAPAPEGLIEEPENEPIPLSEVTEATFVRLSTGLPPLDHVLGGGLVVASVVLLASPPGIGKSSLTLQMLDGLQHRCLYVTGEETREQVAATARRIGAASGKIYVLAERHLDLIFAKARNIRAQTIAIDSIQKMNCADVSGRAGCTSQLKECTSRLVQYAKTTGTTIWLIGHVTSDGEIAGPKTIEHDVDVVLDLEQGAALEGNERILRVPTKNRFGPTNVVGRLEITAKGFACVDEDGWNERL